MFRVDSLNKNLLNHTEFIRIHNRKPLLKSFLYCILEKTPYQRTIVLRDDIQFDLFKHTLEISLKDLGIGRVIIRQVGNAIEKHRDDILERDPTRSLWNEHTLVTSVVGVFLLATVVGMFKNRNSF
ncbi:hypothetical protein HDV02_002034 [Globomyces sp. JEL0801]|nr:hypothetical protein HDV02_002034 [Globomyces sp. JEL0801]